MFQGDISLTNESLRLAQNTLSDWNNNDHQLDMIRVDGEIVGFLHIGYRGGNVAWIEDIFIDKTWRSRGIATEAIHLAEASIKANPAYTAVCLEVVPKNEAALRLYHKLGYDTISIITVRKELYTNTRDRKEEIFGLDFYI